MPQSSVGLLARLDRWLIPSESERLRFNQAEQRQRNARRWLASALLAGAVAQAAFDRASWLVVVVGALVFALFYLRLPVRARAVHLLALVMATQVLVAVTVAQTGGARSAGLCMLLVAPMGLLPRFGRRALVVGFTVCAAVTAGVLLVDHPQESTGPDWLWFLQLALATVGVLASTWSSVSSERHARTLSQTDQLTGTFRREILYADLAAAVEEEAQHDGQICVLVVDVDGFKLVNDTDGHAAGDVVLQTIARVIREVAATRGGRVYRSGGDEFVVVCRELGPQDGALLAATISAAVASAGTSLDRQLAVSVGQISVPATPALSPDVLIARADDDMYRAKRSKT